MYFYLIGIDYKSAAIDVRESLYRRRRFILDFWEERVPHGIAMLVTCNRIEIYGVSECADDAFGHIAAFSRDFPDFSKYAYTKLGETQVFRHALRLASGLESQLNGESQILIQLEAWMANGALPFPLKVLWERVISLSRKIRFAAILSEDTNIATLVFEDIEKRLKGKEKYEIAVVGTGKIAEAFASHRPPKIHLTFIAHKNYKKAQALAEYSNGLALPLNSLSRLVGKADVLIGATSSPHYILKKEYFDKYPVRSKHPLYVYDLAVPRDVEPAVEGIDGVCLHNLDTLGTLFDRYNKSVRERIEAASNLVEEALGAPQEVGYGRNY